MNKEKEYELIESCILSDQMSHKQINDYMLKNPDFEKWFKQRVSKRRKTTTGVLYNP